jgi:hypothetical protein
MFKHHAFKFPSSGCSVCLCPLDSKYRRFEELFVRVLFAHILPRKVGLCQLLDELLVSRNQLFLGVARVKHKCVVLTRGEVSHMISC